MPREYTATATTGGGDFGKFIFWFLLLCGVVALFLGLSGKRADECDYMGCHAPPTMTLKRISTGELGRFCDTHGLKKLREGTWTLDLTQ